MQVFESFNELNDYYPAIYDGVASFLTEEDLQEPINGALGGDICIIETEEEYRKMLTELYIRDMAEEVTPGWFLFLLCTNNAGGTSYYVPTSMVKPEDYEGKL